LSERKIFFAIIVAAILARVFAIVMMPDAPLTDTLFHLSITKYIIEFGAIPWAGIGSGTMPVPLFHILAAVPFIVFPIEFNLTTARMFPTIFSTLQLILSYVLLKKMFPKTWYIGFALIAMQPLLIIYGSLNYLETLASVTVLLCFYIYYCYLQTRKTMYLIVMPFALALMALSKESATILVPVFFIAFFYELLVKEKIPKFAKSLERKAEYYMEKGNALQAQESIND